jgi:transcriptional regulator with XRE-family HTH domain
MLQRPLADKLGVSQQALSSYETGRTRVPDDVAARLAVLWELPEADVRRFLGLRVPEQPADGPPPPGFPENALRLPDGVKLSDLSPKEQALLESIVDTFLDQVLREDRDR